MKLKKFQFIAICIGVAVFIVIATHFLWVPNKPVEAKYQYVAAAYRINITGLRQSFHRPDCKWAKEIKSNNLLRFKTREEAIQSGRRPCKLCKP